MAFLLQGHRNPDSTRVLHRHRNRRLRTCDGPVQRVALDGFAASFADETHEFLAAHALRSGSTGIVINLLFNDRPVNIVGAEAQRNLRSEICAILGVIICQ